MKKILIVAVFALFGISNAEAQVTFKPGIRAGANFSHLTKGDSDYYYNDYYYDPYYNDNRGIDFKSKTDFYVGFYGALKLTRYYTLQPEVTYSRQGTKYEYSQVVYDNVNEYNAVYTRSGQLNVSYLSIAIVNKFTFNDKFNVHIGPTIDFVVEKDRNSGYSYSSYRDVDSDVDLAFIAGVGYNFTKNIGLEARVKKGIIPVLDFSDSSHTNVVFSVGATYTFDVK